MRLLLLTILSLLLLTGCDISITFNEDTPKFTWGKELNNVTYTYRMVYENGNEKVTRGTLRTIGCSDYPTVTFYEGNSFRHVPLNKDARWDTNTFATTDTTAKAQTEWFTIEFALSGGGSIEKTVRQKIKVFSPDHREIDYLTRMLSQPIVHNTCDEPE